MSTCRIIVAGILFAALIQCRAQTNSFVNFETAPVHPVDINQDASLLAVANLPDGRVEIFDISGNRLNLLGSVPVGIDPVTVRFRSTNELWVVNQISDSVSVIMLPELRVALTVATGDAPADVVFAGSPEAAFVSCATTNAVFVYNLFQAPILTRIIPIDGDRPKALARSKDGRFVYVAIFESGNSSTILGGDFAGLNNFPAPSVVDFPQGPYGGQNPPPNLGDAFIPAINPDIPSTNPPPRVSHIVRKNDDHRWLDDNGGDWTEFISGTNSFFSGRPAGWDVRDHDIAEIDTRTFVTPRYIRRLMTICMALAVHPVSGEVTLVGTDALNEVRFEPVVNGVFTRVKIALANATTHGRRVRDLNPHLDYRSNRLPAERKQRSIGDPRAIVWNRAGTRAFIAGMGSNNILIVDENGQPVEPAPVIAVARGPAGLALDESRGRLYVWSRFENTLSVIDLSDHTIRETLPLFDPTPAVIRLGRPHLYDTHQTSGLGHLACASCHVDARLDRIAWDLGAPNAEVLPVTVTNRNFSRFPPGERRDFHPMKGPMMTQTLQDIIGHEPFHWRGDKDGIEQFNGAFTNLQAAVTSLTTNEMRDFKGFLASIHFPPNAYRTFSNTFPSQIVLSGMLTTGHRERPAGTALPPGSPNQGMEIFRRTGNSGCIHCHALPTGLGPHQTFVTNRWRDLRSGPNGERHVALIGVRRSNLLPFKIPALRNLNEKVGMTFQSASSRNGFGFLHDGSIDSLVRFIQDSFDIGSDTETAHIISFLFCLTGSDLPQGVITDGDLPIGVAANDAHAAVGKQLTAGGLRDTATFVARALAITRPATSRVDLVVHGLVDGVQRGWVFDRKVNAFRSDRSGETHSVDALQQLSAPTNVFTFTVVPRGSGERLGVDRDLDGFPNQTEILFAADPADAASIPITGLTLRRISDGLEFQWITQPEKTYQLQASPRVSGGAWTDWGAPLPATGAVMRASASLDLVNPSLYFRIRTRSLP